MSTWRNVGITYLKYADICATHVRNALKEPAKTKAKSSSNMHARIIQWEAGKRGDPRKLRLSPPPRCSPPSILAQAAAPHVPSCKSRRSEEGDRETGGEQRLPSRLASTVPASRPRFPSLVPPPPDYLSPSTFAPCMCVATALLWLCSSHAASPPPTHTAGAAAYALRAPIAEIVEKTAAVAASS